MILGILIKLLVSYSVDKKLDNIDNDYSFIHFLSKMQNILLSLSCVVSEFGLKKTKKSSDPVAI